MLDVSVNLYDSRASIRPLSLDNTIKQPSIMVSGSSAPAVTDSGRRVGTTPAALATNQNTVHTGPCTGQLTFDASVSSPPQQTCLVGLLIQDHLACMSTSRQTDSC